MATDTEYAGGIATYKRLHTHTHTPWEYEKDSLRRRKRKLAGEWKEKGVMESEYDHNISYTYMKVFLKVIKKE